MISMRVSGNAHLGQLLQINPTRCFSPAFMGIKTTEYEAGDIFVSGTKKSDSQTNPSTDITQKTRIQFRENLHNMVISSTNTVSDAHGKDAVVFPIPKHDDLVLRVEKTALEGIQDLATDLELVPISHEKSILENKHLGIPLYIITSAKSKIAPKSSVSPLEAMSEKDKIMVLRRVTGEHPAYECGEKLASMIGLDDDKNPDVDTLNNFSYLYGYVKKYYGYEAAKKCLEMFKNGKTYIPAGAFGEASSPFEIVKGKEFYQKYKDFTKSYINYLKSTSEIPQKSYNDAVNFIVQPKDFNVDFQHTDNTFVDKDKQEFNFVDFAYDKTDPKYIYENPVKEFRNVLIGKGFRNINFLSECVPFLPTLKYPGDFMIYPEDFKSAEPYVRTISQKVSQAAPERFKSHKYS